MTSRFCGATIGKKWYIYTLLAFAAAFISYLYIDKQLLELFYPMRGDTLLYPVELLTEMGKSTWYIIISLLLFVYWIDKNSEKSDKALLIFLSVVTSGIVVNIIKVIFGRARPQLYADEHIYGFFWAKLDVLYRSFPSGHATTAIAAWLALALLFPRYRYWLIGIGVLISLSRVVLTQHYLSDVIIGGWLGAITTLILYNMIGFREKKIVNG